MPEPAAIHAPPSDAVPPAAGEPAPHGGDRPRASASTDAGRSVAVLANPYSGTGPNRRRVDRLLDALAARGLDGEVCWTPAERRDALAERNPLRCAVVAGGDGSIADVVNELDAAGRLDGTPLATLPMGNENLFADELSFEKDADRLAAAIDRGATRRIDLGVVNDRLFTLMASAGLDAEVVRRMDRWRTRGSAPGPERGGDERDEDTPPRLRRVNRMSYALRTLAALRSFAYPELTLETDDGRRLSGRHAFIFNMPRYGGGMEIAPQSRPDNGVLDYVVFHRPGVGQLARYAWLVAQGRHLAQGDVSHGRARGLSLRCEAATPIQADGDLAGATPAELSVRPAAARVIDTRPG